MHFSAERSYLSFEGYNEEEYETAYLKDGSTVPPQKDFEDSIFDQATRTFKGTIRWGDNPYEGIVKEEYALKFSEDWSIMNGTQTDTYENGTQTHEDIR